MTRAERRAQLIVIGRATFASKGLDGTSVEEIAALAGISKPVLFEHFGGKEGLYTAVVESEIAVLHESLTQALTTPHATYREVIELGTLALLDYIDTRRDGFRILQREGSSFTGVLDDTRALVERLLARRLVRHGFDRTLSALYARALVGAVESAGMSWVETREPAKEVVAAQLVNLLWNGLSALEHDPQLLTKAAPGSIERRGDTDVPPDDDQG